MDFLEQLQIRAWCVDRGFEVSRTGELLTDPGEAVLERRMYGQQIDPQGQESQVAAWCVGALGHWDECLLWVTLWGAWPSSENWPAYYRTRGIQGERRSLQIAPGHLFASTEAELLWQFVLLVLENAWDAHILPARAGKRVGKRVFVSHDEWVEVRTLS
jgi:hypothetical protein